MWTSIKNFFKISDKIIWEPSTSDTPATFLNIFFLTILFFLGIYHWSLFFNFGHLSFRFLDWPIEFAYYSVIKQSMADGVIPYHISEFVHQTNRFMANPEIIFSPQIILLSFSNVGSFMYMHILLLYCIGFLGCLFIKKHYNLSMYSFFFLFMLFNFNGHITSHIAVGHIMWAGYFLLPFFCYAILRLIDTQDERRFILNTSFILFVLWLQGSFHIYVWCLFFLGFFGLFNLRYLKAVILTVIVTFSLCAVRLIPGIIAFKDATSPTLLGGYASLMDLFYSLAVLYPEQALRPLMWERDIFVGSLGFILLIYLGILIRFDKAKDLSDSKYAALDFPLILMVIMSLGFFYSILFHSPIPFSHSQRLPGRFIIVPVIFLIIIASIRMKYFLHFIRKRLLTKIIALVISFQILFELLSHSRIWRIENIHKKYPDYPPKILERIGLPEDSVYISSVNISFFITVLALVFWVVFYTRFYFKDLRKD